MNCVAMENLASLGVYIDEMIFLTSIIGGGSERLHLLLGRTSRQDHIIDHMVLSWGSISESNKSG